MQILGVILVVLMFGYSFLVILLPYIAGIILSTIIILLIKRKIEERKYIKIKNTVIVIWVGIFLISSPLWFNYISARPNDTYIEMKKMNDNKSLIGLSKEQIEELLGEKKDKYKDEDVYYYSAGTITDYITGGHRKFYIFEVYFDENDIVKSTLIRESP